MNAAILFEPDGYVLDGPKLMGRQAAGNGFLRAAVKGHAGERLWAYTPHRASAEAFRSLVATIDPAAQAGWIPHHQLDGLGQRGVLYRPDSVLGLTARLRLRSGPASFSLCGVTHTLASEGGMDSLVDIVGAPVMPWDALVCTSSAALATVRTVMDAALEQLRWRLGAAVTPPLPQLPVIPLGVHCEDFRASEADRAEARAALDLAEDETAALFAGRLSFNGKAHPFQMYRALQAVAERTGRRIALIQAGQFHNQTIEQVFRASAAEFCPDVRSIFVNGKDAVAYRRSFAAADLFISLSDSIQETFGLTPLEGMAAGLPVVVTDWNGYKDTVRDGVDGFRIPTWAPAPGVGQHLGLDFETLATDFNIYLSRTSTTVSVDMRLLVERLAELVEDPQLRRRLGAAGRERAQSVFDWAVVYRQYQELWGELDAVRRRAAADPEKSAWLAAAPRVQAGRLDPFESFAHYPTAWIGAATGVSRTPEGCIERYRALTARMAFSYWRAPDDLVERVMRELGDRVVTVRALAAATDYAPEVMIQLVSRLAKMGLVALHAPAPAS